MFKKETLRSEDLVSQLVSLFSDEMLSWAYSKTSKREIAEDLVQETFLAAFKGIGRFQEGSSYKTWLFGILNNKIADYHRDRIRKGHDQSKENHLDMFDGKGAWTEGSKPEKWDYEAQLLDDSEFNQVLHLCMDQLPEHWSAALTYKYLSDKKASDICQELQISETNYWQILHRAKLKVRECLESKWFK
ncbi:MAG: sigma-70 family RNA polymerase sigma factor [Cryomorphaceae bacterium]|nr:sigma-70 family RNA polymerase sigma factor [Cryomorphaceae bacterium]